MTCRPDCICSCQQLGCGCNDTVTVSPKGPAPLPVATGQRVECQCTRMVPARTVTSPAGAKVVVKLCPACDRRRCKVCESYEQNPRAVRCTRCGVKFP